MGKRVLELISLIFKFFLNAFKEFLVDDWRVEPRYCDRLSVPSALVSIVVQDPDISPIA